MIKYISFNEYQIIVCHMVYGNPLLLQHKIAIIKYVHKTSTRSVQMLLPMIHENFQVASLLVV